MKSLPTENKVFNKRKFDNFKRFVKICYGERKIKDIIKSIACGNININLLDLVNNFKVTIIVLSNRYSDIVKIQEKLIKEEDDYIRSYKYKILNCIIEGDSEIYRLMNLHISKVMLNYGNIIRHKKQN